MPPYRFWFSLWVALLFIGCTQSSEEGLDLANKTDEQVRLIRRGRAIYMAACTACHNSNPRLKGALGPAVSESSQELLEARIVQGTYPPGYTAKQSTSQMVPLPQYERDIPALYLYLNSVR